MEGSRAWIPRCARAPAPLRRDRSSREPSSESLNPPCHRPGVGRVPLPIPALFPSREPLGWENSSPCGRAPPQLLQNRDLGEARGAQGQVAPSGDFPPFPELFPVSRCCDPSSGALFTWNHQPESRQTHYCAEELQSRPWLSVLFPHPKSSPRSTSQSLQAPGPGLPLPLFPWGKTGNSPLPSAPALSREHPPLPNHPHPSPPPRAPAGLREWRRGAHPEGK